MSSRCAGSALLQAQILRHDHGQRQVVKPAEAPPAACQAASFRHAAHYSKGETSLHRCWHSRLQALGRSWAHTVPWWLQGCKVWLHAFRGTAHHRGCEPSMKRAVWTGVVTSKHLVIQLSASQCSCRRLLFNASMSWCACAHAAQAAYQLCHASLLGHARPERYPAFFTISSKCAPRNPQT